MFSLSDRDHFSLEFHLEVDQNQPLRGVLFLRRQFIQVSESKSVPLIKNRPQIYVSRMALLNAL